MENLGWTNSDLRMAVLAEDYDKKYQFLKRFAIVFSMPVFEMPNDETLYKHQLFETVAGVLADRLDQTRVYIEYRKKAWILQRLGKTTPNENT